MAGDNNKSFVSRKALRDREKERNINRRKILRQRASRLL